jgi:hypothetical protein
MTRIQNSKMSELGALFCFFQHHLFTTGDTILLELHDFPLNVPRPLGYWLNLMAFFRPISLALVALLASAIPDAAQAFAPSSLRAVGAAKAQLPAVPAPRRARFAHAPLRRRTGAGRVCAGQRLPGGTLRMQTRASRVQRAPV